MKRLLSLIVLCLITLNSSSTNAAEVPESFADLADKLIPSVVNISTTQVIKTKIPPLGGGMQGSPFKDLPPGHPLEEFKDLFDKFYQQYGDEGPMERDAMSLGSGFVISEDGLVVTNNHVVESADEIIVSFLDDTKYKAEVVGRDVKTDLALIKIKADKKLPSVKFGDSDAARVGDWVLAIGNPFGLGGTVTAGIISARARDINAGPFDDFIQTDASINRGNSGGPMFNVHGEVVGINTAIFSPSGGSVGIGFAVPSNLAKPIIEQLQKEGKIERGWLGVKIQTVSEEIAESLGMDKGRGALVVEVNKDSPADKAGLKSGDIVTKYDGQDVAVMKKLPRLVANTKIGKTVELEVWRDGKTIKTQVTIAELKEEPKKVFSKTEDQKPENVDTHEVLGINVAELTGSMRQQFSIPDTVEGLMVLAVKDAPRNVAKVMRKGDIILQANQKKVDSVKEFEMAVKEVKAMKRKAVLLQLYRQGETIYLAVPTDEK